jgi:hypothetical protein
MNATFTGNNYAFLRAEGYAASAPLPKGNGRECVATLAQDRRDTICNFRWHSKKKMVVVKGQEGLSCGGLITIQPIK